MYNVILSHDFLEEHDNHLMLCIQTYELRSEKAHENFNIFFQEYGYSYITYNNKLFDNIAS